MRLKDLIPIIIPLFAVTFLTTGCSDDDDASAIPVRLSQTDCGFTYEGGTKIIDIDSQGESWNAVSENTEWCTVETSESTLTVTVIANPAETPRETRVIVKSGATALPLLVSQSGSTTAGALITPDIENLQFKYAGGEFILNVLTEYPWEAELEPSGEESWYAIHTDKSLNLIKVTAGRNTGNLDNTATLRFTVNTGDEPVVKTMSVSQHTYESDPYYGMIGRWELYSDSWVQGTSTHGAGSYCNGRLRELVPYESYLLTDLFTDDFDINPFKMEVKIDDLDGSLSMKLEKPVMSSGTTIAHYYWALTDFGVGQTTPVLTGVISQDRKTISLSGFEDGRGFGQTLYYPEEYGEVYVWYRDLYYATGDVIELRKAD